MLAAVELTVRCSGQAATKRQVQNESEFNESEFVGRLPTHKLG